jgi:hypothetical protein
MPLYFKELELAFIKWYKIHYIKKPTDSAASWVTYKSMLKSAKKNLLKNINELFNKIEKNEIIVMPINPKYRHNEFYIRINPKKLTSKL